MKRVFLARGLLLLLSAAASVAGQQRQPDPNLLAAESYMRRGNCAKALEALEVVFKLDPKPPAGAYLILASCRYSLGDKTMALEALENGLQAHPAAQDLAREYVALLPTVLGKQEVRAKLVLRLKAQPGHPIYSMTLARLLLELEPTSAATGQTLADTARALPRDPEARFLYGQWACLNNRHSLCVAELKKALLLSPPNDQARMQIYTLTAMAFDELGRETEAEAAYRRALQANRKLAQPSPHSTQKFVEFLARQNRDREAQALAGEILKFAASFGPAHFEIAKWLARQNRLEEALAEAKHALDNLDGETETLRAVHAFLAKTYFAAGRPDQAKIHEEWIQSNARQ
jgi:tetratricopeptide (TPR) repeat protein